MWMSGSSSQPGARVFDAGWRFNDPDDLEIGEQQGS